MCLSKAGRRRLETFLLSSRTSHCHPPPSPLTVSHMFLSLNSGFHISPPSFPLAISSLYLLLSMSFTVLITLSASSLSPTVFNPTKECVCPSVLRAKTVHYDTEGKVKDFFAFLLSSVVPPPPVTRIQEGTIVADVCRARYGLVARRRDESWGPGTVRQQWWLS